MMKIYERIKNLRLIKGISQVEIAKKLFISQRAYSDLENGKTKLDIERLEIIAKFYEIKISDLFPSEVSQEYQIKHLS